MNYGVIDIGSNTIRLVVYKVEEGKIECLLNEKHFVQLIHDIKNGLLNEEGKKNLFHALEDLKKRAEKQGLSTLHCFATAPFRALKEVTNLLVEIKRDIGFDVEVLTRDEEARLGVAGALYLSKVKEGVFVDLGGGSMEVSVVKEGAIWQTGGVDCGSVTLSDKFVSKVFPNKRELVNIREFADNCLEEVSFVESASGMNLYCMGGTARSMGQVHRALFNVDAQQQGYSFDCADIKNVYKTILKNGVEGIRLLTKLCPGRLFTFVPGVAMLHRLAKRAQTAKVYFCSYGVREGYLLNKVLKSKSQCEGTEGF